MLHAHGSRLYAISKTDATLTVIDQRRWQVVRTYQLPAGSAPEDVAVVAGEVAWITRAGASRLLRLDLEAIDLLALVCTGLVVREADAHVGAQLGAFVLVGPRRGFLTFSTDLLVSSHLVQFDLDGYVGPQLHVSVDYFAPALAHDRGGAVFLPDGNVGATGVRAFDDETGAELTRDVIPTSGAPTDLLAIARTPKPVR